MLDFDLEHSRDARVCVLRLRGELDMLTVPSVRTALTDALPRGCENVVIDLALVTYADSSSFSLLVWLDRELDAKGGRLVLAGANANVGRVLELSGLIGVAPTIAAVPDLKTALDAFEPVERQLAPIWHEHRTLPAAPDVLPAARSEVADMLKTLPLPESSLFDVRVAAGEALANAIRHGSPGGATDTIDVDVTAYGDRVEIVVTDRGCGFDGLANTCDDLYAESGRGVMFMRAFTDRVDFEALPGGGTRVTLVKHLAAAPQG